jgi:23S rRNA maturation mini-RNase III
MPFKARIFQENVQARIEDAARDVLLRACEAYAALTTPQQKAQCIRKMMDVLDREVDEETRRSRSSCSARSSRATSAVGS